MYNWNDKDARYNSIYQRMMPRVIKVYPIETRRSALSLSGDIKQAVAVHLRRKILQN